MNFYYLLIELIFDFITVFLGFIIVYTAKDNYPKLYWGVITILIGISFITANIGWINIRSKDSFYEFTDLLNIEKMLKWYCVASFLSLFPLASVRPGYLNHIRILFFISPFLIITTIGSCYLTFDGSLTSLENFRDIEFVINNRDVILRLSLFSMTIITPLINLLYTVVRKNIYREMKREMYLFFSFLFVLLIIYIGFTLFLNQIIFNSMGIFSILFALIFSILYIRYENPFSSYLVNSIKSDQEKVEVANNNDLYIEIDKYLHNNYLFISPDYNMSELSKGINVDEKDISQAVKNNGFTGFKEYINYLRLEYFKTIVGETKDKSIKELMFLCGFNSRTTFYRYFSEHYKMSPTFYIENKIYEKQEIN